MTSVLGLLQELNLRGESHMFYVLPGCKCVCTSHIRTLYPGARMNIMDGFDVYDLPDSDIRIFGRSDSSGRIIGLSPMDVQLLDTTFRR